MSDPPPLAKMLIVKLQGLDDHAQSKVNAELESDGPTLSAARISALLKVAGISTTPSQVRALMTHLGGSSDEGVSKESFAALIGTDKGLDSRSARTSGDTSYEMLQRLQALRGDKPSESTSPPPLPPPPRSVASSCSSSSSASPVDLPTNRPVLPRPRLAKVLPPVKNEKGDDDDDDDDDDDENEAHNAMAMDAQLVDSLRQQTLLHRQSEKSMTRELPEKKVTDIPPLPSQAPPQPPPLPPQQAAPSPPPGLELVVETLAGQLIPVEGCAASDTVLAVKLWIEAAEGIPPDQQRLLIGAEQLDDARPLGSYPQLFPQNGSPPAQLCLVVRSSSTVEHHRRWSSSVGDTPSVDSILASVPETSTSSPSSPSSPSTTTRPVKFNAFRSRNDHQSSSNQSSMDSEAFAALVDGRGLGSSRDSSDTLGTTRQLSKDTVSSNGSYVSPTTATIKTATATGRKNNTYSGGGSEGMSQYLKGVSSSSANNPTTAAGNHHLKDTSGAPNWFMKHRHVDAAAVGAVPLEPFQVPRYFKVLTVAFIQHKPELDGDVQLQLDSGAYVKAIAKKGDWMQLAPPQDDGASSGEHWLYTGKQRSLELMLAEISDTRGAEALWRSQRKPGSVRRFSSAFLDDSNTKTHGTSLSSSDSVLLKELQDQQEGGSNSPSGRSASKRSGGATTLSAVEVAMTADDAPKGVITLAFTDIQGSTRLWEHFGEVRMKALLDEHNKIMRKCLKRHRGYEVKTEGDAFMISFQHATQGLGFAIDAQSRLIEAKWPDFLLNEAGVADIAGISEDGAWRGLRVRIGLHTGACLSDLDPTTKRIDYFGNAVNLAARVESQAEGGEIVMSQDTRDAVYWDRDITAMKCESNGSKKSPVELMLEGVVVVSRGLRHLKGIKEPMVCWRVLPRGPLERRADTLKPIEGKKPSSPKGTNNPQVYGSSSGGAGEDEQEESVESLCNEAVQLHAEAAGEKDEDGKQMQRAISLYRRALQASKRASSSPTGSIGFGDPSILFNLGAALQSVGDLDGAVGCFATIVDAIDPGDAHARVQLGVTYHQGGHLAAAAGHYAQALLLLDAGDLETRVAVLVSLAEAQRDQQHLHAACATLSQVCYLDPHTPEPFTELERLRALPFNPSEPPLTLQLLSALAAPSPPHAAPPHLQPLLFAVAQPPPPPLSHGQHPSFHGSEYNSPRPSYMPPSSSSGVGLGGSHTNMLGNIPEEPTSPHRMFSTDFVPTSDGGYGGFPPTSVGGFPPPPPAHVGMHPGDFSHAPPPPYPHAPMPGMHLSGGAYDMRSSLHDPSTYHPPPYDQSLLYPPPPLSAYPPPPQDYHHPPPPPVYDHHPPPPPVYDHLPPPPPMYPNPPTQGRNSLIMSAMSDSDRSAKAFEKLGRAISKWEKEHPSLHFRDFAMTFDASKKGNLSQEELLKMLSKMRTATKVSDKDLASIWSRLDKYRDVNSGLVKVNLEELLAVMASYEISELAEKSASDAHNDDLFQSVRSGKKRLSTFATALAQTYGNGQQYGHAPGSLGHAFSSPRNATNSSKSKKEGKGRGTRTSTDLSEKHRGGVPHYSQSGDPHVKDTDRALYPAERARQKHNAALREKLKAGREALREEDEKRERALQAARSAAANSLLGDQDRNRTRAAAEFLTTRNEAADRQTMAAESESLRQKEARVAAKTEERRARYGQQQQQRGGGEDLHYEAAANEANDALARHKQRAH